MELSYKNIIYGGVTASMLTILNNHERYIASGDFTLEEKMDVLGAKYFTIDLCLDEIVEMFNDMITSRQFEVGDTLHFVKFFLLQALYLNKIDVSTARSLHIKYFGNEYMLSSKIINSKQRSDEPEFVSDLVHYHRYVFEQDSNPEYEELEIKTFQTFLKYLSELGL